jgi:transposase
MKRTLVGIDVSSKKLDICLERPNGRIAAFQLANTSAGHRELIKRLTRRRSQAVVALEASGNYHLELALALDKADGIELMVVNPRAARDFAKAWLHRSKTDKIDAGVLLEFVRRMPFRPWVRPADEEFELRAVARRIAALVKTRTQEKNRLHAAELTSSYLVCHDIELNVRHLGRRIKRLQAQALNLVWKHPRLRKQLAHLTSIKGVAQASAILILGELCVLPKDMTPRQWVAHAGLDPRIFESGQSVLAPARISKMGNRPLRCALYMPAMTAVQFEPNVKAFYEKLIANEKAPLQALVAVMRKLLHAIHGMLRTGTDFDGEKFYALKQLQTA